MTNLIFMLENIDLVLKNVHQRQDQYSTPIQHVLIKGLCVLGSGLAGFPAGTGPILDIMFWSC